MRDENPLGLIVVVIVLTVLAGVLTGSYLVRDRAPVATLDAPLP